MLIKNGTFATASDVFHGDLRIEEGKITQICNTITPGSGEEVIDAQGLWVLPGGVDVHTHMDLDVGIARSTDDFYTGTVAAACGGTTTIVDHMAFGPKGCPLHHQVDVYHKLADDKVVIDYGLHGVIQHVDDGILSEMETLIAAGITSYKFYLTYGFKLSDYEAFRVLQRGKELGLMMTVHPENDGVVSCLRDEFSKQGLTTPHYHAKSRPLECEAEAINRMLLFAHMAGDAPLYIVHLSNGLGLSYVEQARERDQKDVYAETCPQYLFLDDSRYDLPINEALKYIMSPPLRPKENNELLWAGIEHGVFDTIATDHCPFFLSGEKQLGKDDFTKCPNGAPGVEARLALLFSEGVSKGRISVNRLVDLCATRPAKLFGLYPQKGTIAVGSDGDSVLFDPNKKVTLTKSLLHENVDYTPYEGMALTGFPVMTISRGEVIVKNGEFLGKKGRGQFMKRTLFQRP